jgi:hypothetical protein
MTEEEIMRQLSQAVRDENLLAAEEMVTAGQEQHPEWDWPVMATVLWLQRGQLQEEPEPPRQPAWRRWLRWSTVATGKDRPRLRRRVRDPATGRGPAGCLPLGRRPRQGRCASSASLRDRLRPRLTRPSSSRPGATGRPGRART